MNKSFTLIEILVVIVVIGILSAFILVGMSSITSSANIAKVRAFINSMDNALLLGRVSQWKFDEISGTMNNDSWQSNTGSIVGYTVTTAGHGDNNTYGWMSSSNCVSGTCLKFDGINNYVNCGSGTNLQFGTGDFTISFWRKRIAAYKNYAGIVGSSASSEGYVGFYEGLNGEYFEMGNGAIYQSFNITNLRAGSVMNTFQHIVIVVDRDGKMDTYLDGIKKDSITITLSTSLSIGFSTLYIGNFWAGRFNGIVDDVRIYNQAIPTSEIQQNYFLGLNNLYKNKGITLNEFNQRIVELKSNLANND